jgi:hypothetical protein
MNKNVKIAILVAVVLLFAAAGFFFLNKSKSPASSTANNSAGTEPTASENGSVISSIKDALAGSDSFSCTYTDEEGRQTKSFIKNGMVRSDITSTNPDESGSIIVKNNTMYFWNTQKTGFKMTFTEEQEKMAADAAADASNTQQKELMENLEKYKESCKKENVSDSQFTEPAGVTFTDMSKMINPGSGGGATGFPTIDEAQVKKLMEQYSEQ